MEKIRQKIRDIIFQKISRKREIFKKFFPRVTENFFILSLTSHLFSSPPIISPFPIHPTHPSSLTLLLFKYPPTLHSHSSYTPPLSHILFPTLYLSTSYPQVINSLSTAFPQPHILLIDLLSTPLSPLILLFLQSSPL